MDFDEINRILAIVREHELSEFELEREGFKIRIKKGSLDHASGPFPQAGPAAGGYHPVHGPASAGPLAPAAVPDSAPPGEREEVDLVVVKSPIVGTFFRAAEPGAPPFVAVGDRVRKGQVLCIIEAMKLMNEIDSEYDGEVMNVYVENGQPVQYGERLFAIKVRSDV